MTEETILQTPPKCCVYIIWSKSEPVTRFLGCSWKEDDIAAYLEGKELEHTIEEVQTGLFKYPLWLLEKWDGDKNSFEVITCEDVLLERLSAIKPVEKKVIPGDEDEYPYTLYPIGENTYTQEGMGELNHHHIDDYLLANLEGGWWDLPYEFVDTGISVFKNEKYAGFTLSWAAKRIGWGEINFRKNAEDAEDAPYTVDTECMSDEFCIAALTDFFKRCKQRE